MRHDEIHGDDAMTETASSDPRLSLRRSDVVMLLFATIFPTLSAWLYFDVFGKSGMVPYFYGTGKAIQFALPVVWVFALGRPGASLGSPRGQRARDGLILGLCILATTLVLYFGYLDSSGYLDGMRAALHGKLTDFRLDTLTKYVLFGVFVSLLHSFLEEYYWRWFVFRQLHRGMPFLMAALLSSLAFMGHHVIIVKAYIEPQHFWTMAMFLSGCVGLGGFLWCWLYKRSGSILGPWVAHVLADAGIFIVGWHQVWGKQ
jgi:membrane protease YdiL (CAAX protease family)